MKKSTIIGMVLCIIVFAIGIICMLSGKITAINLCILTAVSCFVLINYLIGKQFNKNHTPVRYSDKYKYREQTHIMGL